MRNKAMNPRILPTIVVLLTALTTPAHAESPKEATASLLESRITSAIGREDYLNAEKLFNNYGVLGLEIPVPLKFEHAKVYQKLGKFGLASQELEQYLIVVERNSKGYVDALKNYGKIKKFENSLSHVGAIDEAVDSLTNKITSAIDYGDYSAAGELFKKYEAVELEIPVPLKVPRAVVYQKLDKFNLAERELEQYFTIMGQDWQSSVDALVLYRKIKESEEE